MRLSEALSFCTRKYLDVMRCPAEREAQPRRASRCSLPWSAGRVPGGIGSMLLGSVKRNPLRWISEPAGPRCPEISGHLFRTVPERLSNSSRFSSLPFRRFSIIRIEHNRKGRFIGQFRGRCATVHPEIKKLFEAAHVVTWFRAQNPPRNHPEKHTGNERKTQENKVKLERKRHRKTVKKSKRKSL